MTLILTEQLRMLVFLSRHVENENDFSGIVNWFDPVVFYGKPVIETSKPFHSYPGHCKNLRLEWLELTSAKERNKIWSHSYDFQRTTV